MLEDFVALSVAVALAVGAIGPVRRRFSPEVLQKQHEVAGIAYAVLSSLYGVILAFVLVSSWGQFDDVRRTIELEVDAVGNVRRHSYGFAEPAGSAIRAAIVEYLRSVISSEWPAMERAEASVEGLHHYTALWSTVLNVQPANDKETSLWQATIEQMDALSTARRERVLFANATVPGMVWGFLVVFGVITVGFTYLFGPESIHTHRLIAGALAAAIASTLILIHETQTPFQGALTLGPQPFQLLLDQAQVEESRAKTP